VGSQANAPACELLERGAQAALERKDFRGALTFLMRAYGTEVYRLCIDLVGDPHGAEDLLQTVFVQAFESFPRYVPRSTLRAWLHGIARNRCLDALRGRRRWRLMEVPEELPEPVDPGPSGEDRLSALERKNALEDCLQRLPPKARQSVHLRFRAQLSYDEMSEICGEQTGTLRVRVARAMPLLRRCLEEKGSP